MSDADSSLKPPRDTMAYTIEYGIRSVLLTRELHLGQVALLRSLPVAYRNFDWASKWIDQWDEAWPRMSDTELERLYLRACVAGLETEQDFVDAITGFCPEELGDVPAIWARLQEARRAAAKARADDERARAIWWAHGNVPLPEVEGNRRLAWVRTVGPEDWHGIVDGWNCDDGTEELDFIVSQPTCDRATAVLALFMTEASSQVARPSRDEVPSLEYEAYDMAHKIAANLGRGFYASHDFPAEINSTEITMYFEAVERMRAQGRLDPVWDVPRTSFGPFEGREPRSIYTVMHGYVKYSPNHFREHILPTLTLT